jgi:diguanylate cyclase (GGDEF)-like protein
MEFAQSRQTKYGSAQAKLSDLVLLVCTGNASCELQSNQIGDAILANDLADSFAANSSNSIPLAEEFIVIGNEHDSIGILTEMDLLRGIALLESKENQAFPIAQDLLNLQIKVIYQHFNQGNSREDSQASKLPTPPSSFTALNIYQQSQIEYFLFNQLERISEQQPAQIQEKKSESIYCLTDILEEFRQSTLLKKHSVKEVMDAKISVLGGNAKIREVIDYMLTEQKPYAVLSLNSSQTVSLSNSPSNSPSNSLSNFSGDRQLYLITCLEILQLWLHHQNPGFSNTALSSFSLITENQFFYGIDLEENLWTALLQMQRLQVSHLMVFERSPLHPNKNLIGVISLKDFVKVFTLESMYDAIESLQQNLNLALTQKAELLLNCIDQVGGKDLMGGDFSQPQLEQEYKIAFANLKIRQSFSLEEILETTVDEVSNWLQADRVLLYRFSSNTEQNRGQIVAESVSHPRLSLINQPLTQSFSESCWLDFYERGIARVIHDLDDSFAMPDAVPISESDRQFLLQLQVKSSLVVAIPQGKKLWGLLVIHQCSVARQWQSTEIEFVERLAPRLSINFHQAVLLDNSLTEFDERRQVERKLLHNALHDPLTDLPNRILVLERLEFLAKQSVTNFALLLFDLNRFKLINDGLGHLIGDRVLLELVARLKQIIGTQMLARIGEEDFLILLENLQAENETLLMIEKLQLLLQQPFNLFELTDTLIDPSSSHNVMLSASVGIVLGSSRLKPGEILRDADAAMQFAKRQLQPYAFFTESMRQGVLVRLQLENELRQALRQQAFSLHYQPIIDTSSKEIVGFEALLRWSSDRRGLVYPQEFIPIIEETGLIVPIGAWILQTACEQMYQWQQRFPHQPPLTINVNVSNVQLEQPSFVDLVQQALISTGLSPNSLHLEITESVLMHNITQTHKKLETLRSLGVEVHIDDFGTGYSSFSYLQNLPVDGLKIDRSFISRITEDHSSLQIVQVIINLAKGLGKTITAEGIETQEQLLRFMGMGKEKVQGYYFSQPVTAETVAEMIENGFLEKFEALPRP